MRKVLLLPFMLLMALVAHAEVTSLRLEMLTGGELTSSLAQIGKIVMGEDDIVLYDKSGAPIGSTPFSQFEKIVFYDDGSQAIDDVSAPSLQILYDAMQGSILVRGIDGQQVVRVYSTSGQLLQSAPAANGEAVLPVGGLQNGAYLLQAGAQVVKFIKE